MNINIGINNTLIATVLFSITFFLGCGKGISPEDVSGHYEHDEETFILNSDGTGEYSAGVGEPEAIKWKIDGAHITFESEIVGGVEFTLKEGNLFLEATSTTYKKIK
jgi:hypothetical protein